MAALPVLTRRTGVGVLELRELRRRDVRAWREVRSRNVAWLSPWEATGEVAAGAVVSVMPLGRS